MPGTTKQYFLHGILLPGGTWIGVATDLTPAANIEHLTAYAGAATVPSFRGGAKAVPDVSFTTTQINDILNECTDGDGISLADYSAGNVDLFFRRATNFSTRDTIGTATALRLRAYRSMMYWTRIEARQDQAATIECRVIPTWDGTNNPIVGLGTQTIASMLLAQNQYTLGPVKLNGAWIDGVEGFTLEQNHELNEKASDGQIFLTFAGIRRSDPILNVDTPDLDQWVSPGTDGVAITALLAYLTKRKKDSTSNVADATAEHIKFSGADNPGGLATVEQGSGGIDAPGSVGLRIATAISTATTLHPLTVDTAAAIA